MADLNKSRPGGRAALVWLLFFIVVASTWLFMGRSTVTEFDQTRFEEKLRDGAIVSAEVTSESERVLNIRGTYRETGSAAELKYKTRVMYSAELDEALKKNTKVSIETSSDTLRLLVLNLLPVLLIIGVIVFFMNRQSRINGRGAMEFGKSRARMIPPDELHVSFDDIAGADEAKEEIVEIVDYLKDPLKFMQVGGRIPRGCLLVGDPGTGKTLMAKAVACEAGVPFFSISGSDFVEMFVGVGASRVRDMFEQARQNTPCLIFIDEIDAVGRSRFSGLGGGHDEREQTLNAMLVEMDGLESRAGVIVLAATNRPDVLDPALLRPGRFDRQIVMDLPDIGGRRKILDVHIKNIKVGNNVDLDVLARTTPGFSGADLGNLCNEAALLAARHERPEVCQADLEEARDKVRYGRERRSRKITERERRLTAYHEAGHALIALHLPHCTPVHKVTIIPRGRAYLGATFTMPKEDVYTHSRLELLDEMVMCMGGRVAEELVMGDVTTGATGDIGQVTRIARQMVCAFGMTDRLGTVKYSDSQRSVYIRYDAPQEDMVSPETAREIDLETRRLVDDALRRARELLTMYRGELEKLANALLEKETMDVTEIEKLLGIKAPFSDEPGNTVLRPEV